MPTRREHFPLRKIVVSVEKSKHSAKAFDAALDLAHKYSSSLLVIHVVTYPIRLAEVEEGEKLVNRFVKYAEGLGLDASGRVVRSKSSVLQGILKQAEDDGADLIVVGTRGLAGLRKFFRGSVSSGVASHSQQSVLIIK